MEAIVLHWPGMAGQGARAVRDYWASPANSSGASAHCAIDQDGTIVQAIPWYERAYHVGSAQIDPVSMRIYTDFARELFGDFATQPKMTSPNHCTIGIEMCHVDEAGTYTPETVAAAVELCSYLCGQYHLDPATRIIRHVDVVGWKRCPAWYIDHPEDLDAFRAAVAEKMAG
jgi:N-acetylmuramoyl-L-alanine amidase